MSSGQSREVWLEAPEVTLTGTPLTCPTSAWSGGFPYSSHDHIATMQQEHIYFLKLSVLHTAWRIAPKPTSGISAPLTPQLPLGRPVPGVETSSSGKHRFRPFLLDLLWANRPHS